jgi:uridine phosphorylase
VATEDPKVFHLALNRTMLGGAALAILPGEPSRSERIAARMSNPRPLASKREFTSWLGELDGKPVVVCSTGIGGPSTSIAVEELAQLGVRRFLRVGTTGAIQPEIEPGEVIVTTASVRLDGASRHFAPVEYPAVADFACATALVAAARALGVGVHVGITASSDTFYPGQERYDTFSGRVDAPWQGSMARWQALNVLNYEMESATLLTMCAALGLSAGVVTAVVANRTRSELPDGAVMASAEEAAISVVVEAARRLLESALR